MEPEYLLLKWGTLKGWNLTSDKSKAAFRRWANDGVSWSLMAQRDTDDQKKALCDLIDVVDGEIQNDWSGDQMTKDEAKKYILEYRS